MARGQYGEPQRKRTNPLTRDLYPIPPNEEFLYVHFPSNWQFLELDGDWTWLPLVQQVRLARGANGITGDKDHRDPSVYVAKVLRNGGTPIYPDDKRLGDYRDYVLIVDCVHKGRKGKYHLTEFETLRVIGGQTRVTTDDQGWRKFLHYLDTEGIVEPMAHAVLEIEVEKQDRRVENMQRRAGTNPHLADGLKHTLERRAKMAPAWERQYGASASGGSDEGGPTPKRGPVRPTKARAEAPTPEPTP